MWGGAGGDGTSYLEDHEYVDVTTPAQESFVSDPPDGKVPYTPWALAKRKEILAGLARGWPGESGERLYTLSGIVLSRLRCRASRSTAQEIVQKPGSVIMLSDDGVPRHPDRRASALSARTRSSGSGTRVAAGKAIRWSSR